jgi:hypothetical protein
MDLSSIILVNSPTNEVLSVDAKYIPYRVLLLLIA